jgi:hypothetical protein
VGLGQALDSPVHRVVLELLEELAPQQQGSVQALGKHQTLAAERHPLEQASVHRRRWAVQPRGVQRNEAQSNIDKVTLN